VKSWATTGLAVALVGIVLTSPAIVFIGGAIVLVRILADVWPAHTLEMLDYEHEIRPAKTVVGEPVELRMALWNRSRLPVAWAGSRDALGEHLAADDPLLAIAGPMRPYERVTRRVRLTPTRRGVHEVGPTRLTVPELFGTHMLNDTSELEPARVVVRPLMAPVIGQTPAVGPLAQARARRSLFTDPTLFAGTRPFESGDPLRSVHWRASARAGRLQTKRFEPALSRQQMIVLDVQTIEGPYWVLNYDDELFEDLCVATLSMARSLVSSDAAVGLAAAGFSGTTQKFVYLPPRADWQQVQRIGDLLARLTPESSAPLVQLLGWLPQRLARGTTVVVLTGFPVQVLLVRQTADHLVEARRLGLAAWPANVVAERGVPSAVVVGG
jgi:uncharacterized protein (DUF58 family)